MSPRFAPCARLLVDAAAMGIAFAVFIVQPAKRSTWIATALILVAGFILGELLFNRLADREARARDLEERKNELPGT